MHIGDLEGQGLCIYNTLVETIPDLLHGWDVMTGRSYELPIVTFERLALRDIDQVHELGLEFAVQKKLEPSKMDEKYGITHTCEADAIPPTMVRDLVREAVEIWHDEQAYEGGLAQEDRDRADLRDWLARAA